MTEPAEPRPLPLIPLLRAEEGVPDQDVLATWHEALADSVGVELPHHLFALWLYPASGGVELIGPGEAEGSYRVYEVEGGATVTLGYR